MLARLPLHAKRGSLAETAAWATKQVSWIVREHELRRASFRRERTRRWWVLMKMLPLPKSRRRFRTYRRPPSGKGIRIRPGPGSVSSDVC